jgi:DNA-binding response OmpR family regulator
MTDRILVVDDEEDILIALKTFYEQHNIEVIAVNNGKDCIKAIERGYSGIVLIDIMMPKMDGWDTIREIVNRQLIDRVKIKIITGKGTKDHSKIADLASYVEDYIGKPFSNETLLAMIQE